MNFSFRGYKILIDQKLEKYMKKNLPNEYREVFEGCKAIANDLKK